jgi:pilus assembly protein FimV
VVARSRRARRLAVLSALGAASVLAFAACNSGSTPSPSGGVAGATGTPPTGSVEPSVAASPSAEASAPTRITIVFQPVNSDILGGGFVSDLGDGRTVVTLGVVAVDFTEPLPAVLGQGSCADLTAGASPGASGGASGSPGAVGSPGASAAASEAPSAPAGSAAASAAASPSESGTTSGVTGSPVAGPPFQLIPVTGGSSITIIQSRLGDLLATPYAVVLSKSATDQTIVGCADVTATPNVPSASGLPSALPSPSSS